jgi:plastocyanin
VRRLAVAGALAAMLATAAPPAAPAHTRDYRSAAVVAVSVQFSAFAPGQVDALPGDTVEWSNASPRTHTVTSDTGAFGSPVLAAGATFSIVAGAPGTYSYHCQIHPTMVGEVDVWRVTLGPLPPAPIPKGTRVQMSGRTADPSQPVRIERSADGTSFTPSDSVTPRPDGAWTADVTAQTTSYYRAASGPAVSETRRLLVTDRHVKLRATRRGVLVTVSPSDPGARIVLERRLRERFGWWPVARKRLDFVSEAAFRARHTGRLRAVLVDVDGWTPLATSRVLTFRRR